MVIISFLGVATERIHHDLPFHSQQANPILQKEVYTTSNSNDGNAAPLTV
jgi:hypothetical protein